MQVSGPKFNNFNFSSSIFLKYFKMRKQNIWDTSIWKWFEGHWKVRLSFQDELGPSPNQGRGGRKRPELFLDKFHQCKPMQTNPIQASEGGKDQNSFWTISTTDANLQCAPMCNHHLHLLNSKSGQRVTKTLSDYFHQQVFISWGP